MVESAQNRLGYSPDVTALVLPMAVSLFRITSPVQYIGVSCSSPGSTASICRRASWPPARRWRW